MMERKCLTKIKKLKTQERENTGKSAIKIRENKYSSSIESIEKRLPMLVEIVSTKMYLVLG
jgi:hypothetical protein